MKSTFNISLVILFTCCSFMVLLTLGVFFAKFDNRVNVDLYLDSNYQVVSMSPGIIPDAVINVIGDDDDYNSGDEHGAIDRVLGNESIDTTHSWYSDHADTMEYLSANAVTSIEPVSPINQLRNKRILFYGTSFTRELYFETFRYLTYDGTMDVESKFIPSYTKELVVGKDACIELGDKATNLSVTDGDYACIKRDRTTRGCNHPGKAGVDIEKCGVPGYKQHTFNDTNTTIAFQFKTYVYTPEAETVTIPRMIENGPWDLIIFGSQEWGLNRHVNTTIHTHDVQSKYFLNEIIDKIDANKVFVYNIGYNDSTDSVYEAIISASKPEILVYNMRGIKDDARKNHVERGHGMSGIVTKRIVSDVLSTVL